MDNLYQFICAHGRFKKRRSNYNKPIRKYDFVTRELLNEHIVVKLRTSELAAKIPNCWSLQYDFSLFSLFSKIITMEHNVCVQSSSGNFITGAWFPLSLVHTFLRHSAPVASPFPLF
jgi:hypothetical protein